MNILENILSRLLYTLANLLVKEDQRLEKLLKLEPGEMYLRLPKSKRKIDKNCIAIFDYSNNAVKNIIKSIKFKNNFSMKKRLATYLYDELLSLSSDIELFHGSPPVIIPMPMSEKEKKERGFNQCEEICTGLKRIAGESLKIEFGILEKVRNTARQVRLNREERLKNLYKSFNTNQKEVENIKGKVVIVFDDVYTTGSTFLESRRALLSSGAKDVYGIFLAH